MKAIATAIYLYDEFIASFKAIAAAIYLNDEFILSEFIEK